MRTPSPGPTSSTTSSGSSPASRSITPSTLRSTRKCWPSDLLRRDPAHRATSPNAAVAFSSIRDLELLRRLAPSGRERGERVDDVHRLVRPPAHGLRGEVRAVRLREDPVRGDPRGRVAERLRLRVGDVPRERDVVAALERGLQQVGLGEAVQDDRPVERERVPPPSRRSPLGCGSTTGRPRSVRERELRVEEDSLLAQGLGAVVTVEPGLADRHDARLPEELPQLAQPRRLRSRRLVRVDPERRENTRVLVRDRQRPPARLDARCRSSRRASTPASRALARISPSPPSQRIEMRVRVDHAAAPRIRSSSEATTVSGSSFAKSGEGFARGRPGTSVLGSHRPTHEA